ncbi:hypothetical protein [Lentibacillus sp.]|uniref:hypothetical protein n=1 Tax=Lentibacillus sp. TaxID=1925746 RepID=UPI002B4AE784|nr:hypothetical protein [Lentibacillus sp.]HLS09297.1 hypothetical protein [Lentibacillus sp.]
MISLLLGTLGFIILALLFLAILPALLTVGKWVLIISGIALGLFIAAGIIAGIAEGIKEDKDNKS